MVGFLERTLNQIYTQCQINNQFVSIKTVDKREISSILCVSKIKIEVAELLIKNIDKTSDKWLVVYELYYDALRELVEAFLISDRIKVLNHQCLFAYLCYPHPELELDWRFLEKLRIKRNGIEYYGTIIDYNNFKEIELQLKLYIKLIRDNITKNL